MRDISHSNHYSTRELSNAVEDKSFARLELSLENLSFLFGSSIISVFTKWQLGLVTSEEMSAGNPSHKAVICVSVPSKET